MLITTNTNPGTVDPARQGFPPPPTPPSTPSTTPLQCSTGEMQFPAVRTAKILPTSGAGLPTEIRVSDASCVLAIPPTIAQTTSPAKDVRADAGKPGGLAKNVYIR